MQKQFLMQLNLCTFTVAWHRLQRESQLVELASGHLAVDILEFAEGKWTPPKGQADFPMCRALPARTWVATTELEMQSQSRQEAVEVVPSISQSTTDAEARAVARSTSTELVQPETKRAGMDRHPNADRRTESSTLARAGHQGDSSAQLSDTLPNGQGVDANGKSGTDDNVSLAIPLEDDYRTSSSGRAMCPIQGHQRPDDGNASDAFHGTTSRQGPSVMYSPSRADDQSSQSPAQLVHMQGMRIQVGSPAICRSCSGGQRLGGVWPLQEQLPEGCAHGVHAVGNQHGEGSGRGHRPHVAAACE
eukprot:1841105-Amphidinium_carterae.1